MNSHDSSGKYHYPTPGDAFDSAVAQFRSEFKIAFLQSRSTLESHKFKWVYSLSSDDIAEGWKIMCHCKFES